MLRKFTPEECEVFHFRWPDGSEGRMDPLRVRRMLTMATQGHLDEWLDAALTTDGGGDPERAVWLRCDAEDKLVATTFRVFEVEQVPGLEQWAWDLLLSFDEWYQKKSGSTPTTCTSPPPAGSHQELTILGS